MSPEIGDLILSRKPNAFSLPIRLLTGSQWTHVDVYIGDGKVVGAVWPKVRTAELKDIPIYSVWRLKNLTLEQKQEIANFVSSKLGTPYDWKLFFILAWRLITNKLGIYHGDPDENSYLCSELVAIACLKQGVKFAEYTDCVLPKHISESEFTENIYNVGV